MNILKQYVERFLHFKYTCLSASIYACMHEVLLMQWNSHFDFASDPFDFIELFAGQGQCSKAWTKPQGLDVVLLHDLI